MKRKDCSCKNIKCPRHGDCEACREHHHEHGGLTYCERISEDI